VAATADLELMAPPTLGSRRKYADDDARRLLWVSFSFFVGGSASASDFDTVERKISNSHSPGIHASATIPLTRR
jgi:hypothetical protein